MQQKLRSGQGVAMKCSIAASSKFLSIDAMGLHIEPTKQASRLKRRTSTIMKARHPSCYLLLWIDFGLHCFPQK